MSTRATYLSTGLHGFRVRSPAGLSPDYNEFPTLIDGDQFLKTKKGPQNVRFSRLEKTSTFEVRGTCIFGVKLQFWQKWNFFFFFFFFQKLHWEAILAPLFISVCQDSETIVPIGDSIRGQPEMSTFSAYEIPSHNFLTPSFSPLAIP